MVMLKGTKLRAYPGREELERLYVTERLSTRACATALGIGHGTLCCWLEEAGIPRRSIADAKAGQKPAARTIEASVSSRRRHLLEGMPSVGYKLRPDGYVYVRRPEHPNATVSGYILEHRLVMSEALGRALTALEDVHHVNGDRRDNRLENLLLVAHADHLREHYSSREIDALGRFV